MTILACLLAVCLVFVRGDARVGRRSIDEAMRKVSGNKITSRSMGDKIVDGQDMVLTQRQYDQLYGKVQGRTYDETIIPWTDGVVPYVIERDDFSPEEMVTILQGMITWEAVTCLKFREARSSDESKITIFNGEGCWSHLGMNTDTDQELSMNIDGCFNMGTIEHELGHAIGLVHEHQRPNRIDHVKVYMDNVEPNNTYDLIIYSSSTTKMGLGYDYYSIMHYGHYAYSRNDKPTISAYNSKTGQYLPEVDKVLGKMLGLSYLDVKLVNLMYNCSAKCQRPPSCRSDCFVDKNCNCICKEDMPPVPCEDSDRKCRFVPKQQCFTKRTINELYCMKSCGLCGVNGTTLPPAEPNVPCEDYEKTYCPFWKENGECTKNPDYMHANCRKSCGICTGNGESNVPCEDYNEKYCKVWKEYGKCTTDPDSMNLFCQKTCGICTGN